LQKIEHSYSCIILFLPSLFAAQVAFVVVFLQELVQGKGVVQGLQEGDPVNVAVAGAAAASVLGLTVWLAIKGDDDYVARELGKK
jgi:hypothetical protein